MPFNWYINDKIGTFKLWNKIQEYYFYKMRNSATTRQREMLNAYC